MSDIIFIYALFSWCFMLGSALADESNVKWYIYLIVVIVAPVTMPFALGFVSTSK